MGLGEGGCLQLQSPRSSCASGAVCLDQQTSSAMGAGTSFERFFEARLDRQTSGSGEGGAPFAQEREVLIPMRWETTIAA